MDQETMKSKEFARMVVDEIVKETDMMKLFPDMSKQLADMKKASAVKDQELSTITRLMNAKESELAAVQASRDTLQKILDVFQQEHTQQINKIHQEHSQQLNKMRLEFAEEDMERELLMIQEHDKTTEKVIENWSTQYEEEATAMIHRIAHMGDTDRAMQKASLSKKHDQLKILLEELKSISQSVNEVRETVKEFKGSDGILSNLRSIVLDLSRQRAGGLTQMAQRLDQMMRLNQQHKEIDKQNNEIERLAKCVNDLEQKKLHLERELASRTQEAQDGSTTDNPT